MLQQLRGCIEAGLWLMQLSAGSIEQQAVEIVAMQQSCCQILRCMSGARRRMNRRQRQLTARWPRFHLWRAGA